MPEQREKRKKEQAEAKQTGRRRVFTVIVILVLLIAAYGAGWYRKSHRYDELGQCMASKQVKMYGAYWCPHCAEQKEILGKSYHFVYQECGVPGSHAESAECIALGVKEFPTWRFPNGTMAPGVFSVDELSGRTGCSL
jgi:glutaredoxin